MKTVKITGLIVLMFKSWWEEQPSYTLLTFYVYATVHAEQNLPNDKYNICTSCPVRSYPLSVSRLQSISTEFWSLLAFYTLSGNWQTLGTNFESKPANHKLIAEVTAGGIPNYWLENEKWREIWTKLSIGLLCKRTLKTIYIATQSKVPGEQRWIYRFHTDK